MVAGVAGQFLVAQEAARGPRLKRVEPEHRAHQQQRTVGPVIAMTVMAALVLQDQALFLRGELLVEVGANHDSRPPQANQCWQAWVATGLPAAIGAWLQRAHAPLETTLRAQVAQQAEAHAHCP